MADAAAPAKAAETSKPRRKKARWSNSKKRKAHNIEAPEEEQKSPAQPKGKGKGGKPRPDDGDSATDGGAEVLANSVEDFDALPWQPVKLGDDKEDLEVGGGEEAVFTFEELPANQYTVVNGKLVFKGLQPSKEVEPAKKVFKGLQPSKEVEPAKKNKASKSKVDSKPKVDAGPKAAALANPSAKDTPAVESAQATAEAKPEAKRKSKTAKKRKRQDSDAGEGAIAAETSLESRQDVLATAPVGMEGWIEFGLANPLLHGLAKLGYNMPTEIQRLCLPKAVRGVDVLGCAETGSGKTLAFGLPILNALITRPVDADDGLAALILAPTRELAVQIASHLDAVLGAYPGKRKPVRVGRLLGGMSMPKQERVLSQRPEIVVATPGRLMALVRDGIEHLSKLTTTLRFLVVDEADRMFDQGHFPDLKPLIELFERSKAAVEAGTNPKPKYKRQTLLFSATLMLTSAQTPKGKKQRVKKPKQAGKGGPRAAAEEKSPLLELMERIGCRGKPATCEVSRSSRPATDDAELEDPAGAQAARTDRVELPKGLSLCSVECIDTAKDYYLYYFATQFPGRTLVFVNTISVLRRVSELLKLLEVDNVTTLHAHMQQRQRLQHLEKFTNSDQGILIATDVAARGLDIKNIRYVIHYSIPKNADVFVHRSGRTARAATKGLCLALVGPTELRAFAKAQSVVGEDRFSEFPVQMSLFPQIKERVTIARRVELLQRRKHEIKADKDWFYNQAKAADIELDVDIADVFDEGEGAEERNITKRERAQRDKELASLKVRLSNMLQSRMLAHFTSTKYVAADPRVAQGRRADEILSGAARDAQKELDDSRGL